MTFILKNGGTALFSASQLGFNDIVELLCSKGANVNLSLEDKTSPTFIASQNGHLKTVKVLEHHRADINRRREVTTKCQTGSFVTFTTLVNTLHMC